jgi:hypothetical protein
MRTFTEVLAEQRSAAWFDARLGRLTGSRAGDMLATNKDGKPSASRKNLLMQLVLERVTCKSQERTVQTQAMQDGIDREADALRLYEHLTGNKVRVSGFLRHDELYAGCSLDGHVGDFEGVVEVKCPMPATHLEYLRSGKVPEGYYWQCIHALWMTGAPWCDWVTYHPEFPENLRLKVVRIAPEKGAIDYYNINVRKFLAEVETEYNAVMTMHDMAGVLKASCA